MQTTVTERGQISIPASIRKKLHLQPGMGVEWIVRDEGIFLMPVPKDPIKAFRGSGGGGLSTKVLLEQRALDKKMDEKKFARRRG